MNQNQKPPPHNAEAEAAILGHVMTWPHTYEAIAEQVAVADLFMPPHISVYEAMGAVAARGRPVEMLVVAEEMRARGTLARLEGQETSLLAMVNAAPIPERIPAMIKLVLDRAMQRRLIASCLDIAAQAAGDRDPGELIDELGARLVSLAGSSQRDLTPIAAHLDEVVEAIERRQVAGKEVTGVETGVYALDRLTGFQPGNDIVIGGRPGEGKTAFALNIARRLARAGGAAIVFSLEMTRAELIERIVCQEGRLDSGRLKIGNTDDLWRDIIGAVERLRPAMLYIVDDQFSLRQMRPTLRRFRARHPEQKVIGVFDYIQLFDIGHGRNTNEAMTEVSTGIKRLAKELAMPLVVVSQLNRESEKQERPPRMSDLRGCGSLEQDADIILLPHNPQRTEEGEVDILIPKNRNGRTGAVRSQWVGRNYTFDNPEGGASYLD